MASASLSVTGTHRILMDLVTGLDRNKFQAIIACKPDFPGPGNDLIDDIRTAGLEVLFLQGRHLFSIDGLWDLYRAVVVHEVDIIHCWDSLSIAARVVGRLVGAKVIDTIGNPPADDSWKNSLANRVTSPLLDGIIYQSVESREAHRKHGSFMLRRGRREAIIYNAVDFRSLPEYPPEERHSIRKRYGFDEEDVVLVNMGMLNRQKSQEHLLEAMPNVLEGHPDVKLMIVGWGERESFLKDCVLSKRLESTFSLRGNAGGRRCLEFFSGRYLCFLLPLGRAPHRRPGSHGLSSSCCGDECDRQSGSSCRSGNRFPGSPSRPRCFEQSYPDTRSGQEPPEANGQQRQNPSGDDVSSRSFHPRT